MIWKLPSCRISLREREWSSFEITCRKNGSEELRAESTTFTLIRVLWHKSSLTSTAKEPTLETLETGESNRIFTPSCSIHRLPNSSRKLSERTCWPFITTNVSSKTRGTCHWWDFSSGWATILSKGHRWRQSIFFFEKLKLSTVKRESCFYLSRDAQCILLWTQCHSRLLWK